MSDFYADLSSDAAELLEEFGQPVTLTHKGASTYDEATATATTAQTTYQAHGVTVDYAERDIDGTKIKRGDQRVYMSAPGVAAPVSDDTMTIGGKAFKVINSSPLAPGGVNVLYDVQVRGLR